MKEYLGMIILIIHFLKNNLNLIVEFIIK
jgi:hypothetical protein